MGNVSPKVEVMVVAEGCAAEGVPDLFSVGIVVIGNAFIFEFAVESLLLREGYLIKSGQTVDILVEVDPLAEQVTPLGFGSKSAVMRMSRGLLASTSSYRFKSINWALSMIHN